MQPLTTEDPTHIGPYLLLGRLGKGGMGMVYLGRTPTRLVAVKVVHGEIARSPGFHDRFAREIDAAGTVAGPYTAAVIDSDPYAERPWLVTEYVDGPNLYQAVRTAGPCSEHALLRLAAGLAEALQSVHRAGLIHRDLKPANVLLAGEGPRVIDFGIAKAFDGTLTKLTPSGVVLGTPGYMSPEQVLGRELTPRSDMFSLGGVLYYAATGRPPFGSDHYITVTRRITDGDLPALDPLPTELRRLVADCLLPLPEDRPAPADVLARIGYLDLNRPAPWPASSGTGSAETAATVPGAYPPTRPYPFVPPESAEPEPLAPRLATALTGHTDSVFSVVYSPDGRRLATAGRDTTARVWNTTGRCLTELTGHSGSVRSVAYSPDGRRLATASRDTTARVWDAATGDVRAVLAAHTDSVWAVTFSPDGHYLATAGDDGTARVWDAATGQELAVLTGHGRPVWGVAFSPDGRHLATASYDHTARVWDGAGKCLAVLAGHSSRVRSVVYSPDGRHLATASDDRTARIWDAATGEERAVLVGHSSPVWPVVYSPDGRHLATASDDRTARIWDTATGQELAVLAGHARPVSSVAYSPDGRHLATASWDHTVRIWRL